MKVNYRSNQGINVISFFYIKIIQISIRVTNDK